MIIIVSQRRILPAKKLPDDVTNALRREEHNLVRENFHLCEYFHQFVTGREGKKKRERGEKLEKIKTQKLRTLMRC